MGVFGGGKGAGLTPAAEGLGPEYYVVGLQVDCVARECGVGYSVWGSVMACRSGRSAIGWEGAMWRSRGVVLRKGV